MAFNWLLWNFWNWKRSFSFTRLFVWIWTTLLLVSLNKHFVDWICLDHKARILVRDYTGKYAWDCRLSFSRHSSLTESDTEKTKSPYLSYTILHKETPFVPFISLSSNLTTSNTSLSSVSSDSSELSYCRSNQLSVPSSEVSGDETTNKKSFEVSTPQSEYSMHYFYSLMTKIFLSLTNQLYVVLFPLWIYKRSI